MNVVSKERILWFLSENVFVIFTTLTSLVQHFTSTKIGKKKKAERYNYFQKIELFCEWIHFKDYSYIVDQMSLKKRVQ